MAVECFDRRARTEIKQQATVKKCSRLDTLEAELVPSRAIYSPESFKKNQNEKSFSFSKSLFRNDFNVINALQ